MPMQSDRKRAGGGRSRSDLDRFLEDPWDEPARQALADDDDDWYPELFDEDEEPLEDLDLEDEELDLDDPADAWGPIRKRRRLRDDDEDV